LQGEESEEMRTEFGVADEGDMLGYAYAGIGPGQLVG
jgi:hypothetical protein